MIIGACSYGHQRANDHAPDDADYEAQCGNMKRRRAVLLGGKAADIGRLGDIDAGHTLAQRAIEVAGHMAASGLLSPAAY